MQKEPNLCCRDEPIPHRGNSCAAGSCSCESCVLCGRDCSHGTKGSGLTFLVTNGTRKMICQPKSQNWSWDWDVIMIKMKEKSTALFIGIRWDQDCEMRSWRVEAQNSWTWIGLNTPLGEATRSGSNVAWVPKIKIPFCTFVSVKDIQVEIDSAWIAGSRRYSMQLARVHISNRKFFRLYFNSQVRTRCWRKNKQTWTTNSFLRTSQSGIWDWTTRIIDK